MRCYTVSSTKDIDLHKAKIDVLTAKPDKMYLGG
jgi:hypothetical protein